MDILSLTSFEIAELLNNPHELSKINNSTILLDKIFNICTGIYYPHIKKYNHLLNLPVFNEINILDITSYSKKQFLVREWNFLDTPSLYIKNLTKMSLEEAILYIQNHKKTYSTLALDKNLFLENHPLSQLPLIKTSNKYSLFPPFQKSLPIYNMAIIYDPSLDQSQQEGQNLFETLQKYFPSFKISIYTTSLSQQKFENILDTYSVVHFSGHMNKKGLVIGRNTYYHPAYSIKNIPTLLFLNTCKITKDILLSFISKNPLLMIYSSKNQLDVSISLEKITLFYFAFLMGYHFSTIVKILDPNSLNFYGWAHYNTQTQFLV